VLGARFILGLSWKRLEVLEPRNLFYPRAFFERIGSILKSFL
jgi:hypothetical protein